MTLGGKIKKRREELGMTLLQLSTKIGVSEATVQRYESGEIKNPTQQRIVALAKALNVDVNYLMGWDDSRPIPATLKPVKRRKIPMLGNIAAGQPIFTEQAYEEYDDDDNNAPHCDFVLRVQGDSMEPKILNNDIVYIRSQPDVNDGQIAAVAIDDTATLKVVYHIQNGLQLISLNPSYPPMIYNQDNSDYLAILGLAVAYKRRI